MNKIKMAVMVGGLAAAILGLAPATQAFQGGEHREIVLPLPS